MNVGSSASAHSEVGVYPECPTATMDTSPNQALSIHSRDGRVVQLTSTLPFVVRHTRTSSGASSLVAHVLVMFGISSSRDVLLDLWLSASTGTRPTHSIPSGLFASIDHICDPLVTYDKNVNDLTWLQHSDSRLHGSSSSIPSN